MIVIYNRPNVLKLPYKTTIKVQQHNKDNSPAFNEDGNPIMINKELPEYFSFVPGKNSISADLWLKIVDYNRDDMDHYNTLLKVFRPESETEIETGATVEIGSDEENLDLSKLSTKEFRELIENTMEIEDLNKYFIFENSRDKIRPSIIRSIKTMKNNVTKADNAVSKSKKDK